MRIREFQLLTESSVISCATSLAYSLASSDCDDPEEQQATVLFDLAGTIRAKKHKGRWEADIVTKEVRYFSFGFQNKKVLAFALSWLPSPIEDEIKNQLFELVETTIPIKLLASLQFLPREDHWLTGSMKLLGNMTEVNGPLKVWSSLDVTAHTMPTRIPGILNETFTLEELAAAFLSDPKLARALSNLIENLPQFRYVIGDRLKSVMEKVNYESSRPARMQIRKISNELSVQFLQPFLKARIGSKAADLRGLNAHLDGGISWNSSDNGLARASFYPKELKLQAGSGEDGNPLYSLAQAPLGLLEELALSELLPKLPAEGELAEVEFRDLEYNPNHISLALAAIRNWAQKPDASANATAKWQIILAEAKAIALRLPQALSLPFGISCKGGKIAIDHSGRIQFLSARNGVEVSQTRPMVRPLREGAQRVSSSGVGDEAWDSRLPAEFQRATTSQLDMTVVDRIDQIGGSVSLDVAGAEKGSLQIKIGGTLQMKVDAKSVVASALAGLPTVDFGYAFFADEFSFYDKDWEERTVMAVLSCGYLRLFQWPLRLEKLKRLEMKSGQRQYDLTKLRGYPTFEKDPQVGPCVLVHFQKGFFGSDVTERLCGAGGKAEALYKAVKLQMRRFEHGRQVHKAQAVNWKFGTHVAGKPQYVLPQDKVQANLQTIFEKYTWSKTHGGSGRPALLQAAATSRISSLVAEGREVDIAQHDANTGEEERRMEAPTTTEKGSFESKACRAQEELDSIHYPPEKYGNASIRMVIPATPIGDVHLLIEKIQVVSLDITASLVRNSDTTFSFELGGSYGPGTVNVYVQGMKFKAPDSALPGITKAASADSIEEGPLKATLKMKGEFKLSEGAFAYLYRSQIFHAVTFGSASSAFPMSQWFQHPCSKSPYHFILCAVQLAALVSANEWTLLFPTGTPAARSGHTMVWDPDEDDGGFWMFGGEVLLSIKSNDLYFYNADGNLWTQKASGPAARYRHSAVLDPAARSLYIFAGTNLASAGNTFNDLHRYDVQLDSWTELTGTVGRSRHTAVWDGTSDRMIVFGGSDNMLNKLGSLAEYDRATDSWSSPAAVGPAARDGHVAVWDPATGSMLMCCGTSGTSLGDLWSYNGAWSQLSPSGSITARRYASAVWDSQAGAMLGFAGSDSGASKLNSLFFYSASTNSWSEYTETGPPAQDRGAAAWDPENARLYAFGGYDWLGLLDGHHDRHDHHDLDNINSLLLLNADFIHIQHHIIINRQQHF
eukprot:s902_g14.t2